MAKSFALGPVMERTHRADDVPDFMTSSNWINCSEPHPPLPEKELIWEIIDYTLVSILCVGLIANIFTVILLAKTKGQISSATSTLIIHQGLMDALVCIFMMPAFIIPTFWTCGNYPADIFLCHFVHSQFLFWWALLMSVWNLVLLAVDRYLAIRKPLKYSTLRPKHYIRVFLVYYAIAVIVSLPAVFEFSYDRHCKKCTSDFYSDSPAFANFIKTYGLFWFAFSYGIPVPLFFILYGLIISALRKRLKNTNLGGSVVIAKANTQATKTFLYVSVFFIFSFSFDSWYYLLYTIGVVEYEYQTPIQVISVCMTALNSCINPFIYAVSMAFIRRAISDMCCCSCYCRKHTYTKQNDVNSGTNDDQQLTQETTHSLVTLCDNQSATITTISGTNHVL